MLTYIESKFQSCRVHQIPNNSALVLDGIAIIHALATSFQELAEFVLRHNVSIAIMNRCFLSISFVTGNQPSASKKLSVR